ncbi:MAG: UDP-N-acetylglucosamine 2-epimerase (non-hydrolyzing) [Candidatus Omnitrophota bacterium]
MKRILFVIGTRPEIIKTAPVILEFKNDISYKVGVCVTGQHKVMAQQMLSVFGIVPDYDLKLMRDKQSLDYIASSALANLKKVYEEFKPSFVFVQGDTTTAFCAALSAYYSKIRVAHIEAGLRTYDKFEPFPEELNRAMISRIADIHFAPTKLSKENLIKENISEKTIVITGNTAIDALFYVRKKVESFSDNELNERIGGRKVILVTAHRRENLGEPLENICNALKKIAQKHKDYLVVYPIHLNPKVLNTVKPMLEGIDNILLIEPLCYKDFVLLMSRAYLILTDSGGIQEEAPSLGVPVLILRDRTERPEVVEAGCAIIVGTDTEAIVSNCSKLLESSEIYESMSKSQNPVGDGTAAVKIKKILDEQFKGE